MQIGQIIDFVVDYNGRNKQEEKPSKPKKRKATQAEIDAFLG